MESRMEARKSGLARRGSGGNRGRRGYRYPSGLYRRISDLRGNGSAFPDLSGMQSMKTMVLRKCSISGSIPSYIGSWTTLKHLRSLPSPPSLPSLPLLRPPRLHLLRAPPPLLWAERRPRGPGRPDPPPLWPSSSPCQTPPPRGPGHRGIRPPREPWMLPPDPALAAFRPWARVRDPLPLLRPRPPPPRPLVPAAIALGAAGASAAASGTWCALSSLPSLSSTAGSPAPVPGAGGSVAQGSWGAPAPQVPAAVVLGAASASAAATGGTRRAPGPRTSAATGLGANGATTAAALVPGARLALGQPPWPPGPLLPPRPSLGRAASAAAALAAALVAVPGQDRGAPWAAAPLAAAVVDDLRGTASHLKAYERAQQILRDPEAKLIEAKLARAYAAQAVAPAAHAAQGKIQGRSNIMGAR
ncbi:basic proline-rich protein-like [Panicum virgatum]|uniref:basic proline-rich protein-like n=1 Tax=Panicum virgatum TaxID=38727 RepID=UPI0019D5C740|nr:basic proline-rich protein-like [Panicum virgatum]